MTVKRLCTILGENYEVLLVPFSVKDYWGFPVVTLEGDAEMVDGGTVKLTEAQRVKAVSAANSIVRDAPEG